MYNLAKLLTEEPKKIERLIILFLKLLISLHVTSLLFSYKWSLSALIADPIPKDCTTIQVVYFLVSVILTWFVLWNIIAEGLLYDLLMWLFSRRANKRKTLLNVLDTLSVVKVKEQRVTGADNNINSFYEFLIHFDDEEEPLGDIRTRLKQYYILVVVTFVLLLTTQDLTRWEIFWGIWFIANLFIGCIIATRIYSYIDDNLEALKREFGPLAYSKKITDAIKEIKLFQNYETPRPEKKIVLKRISGYEAMPEKLKIVAAYHWNQSLGQRFLQYMLRDGKKNIRASEERYFILITNITQNPEIVSAVSNIPNLALIHANTEEEMYNGLEEWIHVIAEQRKNINRQALPHNTEGKP